MTGCSSMLTTDVRDAPSYGQILDEAFAGLGQPTNIPTKYLRALFYYLEGQVNRVRPSSPSTSVTEGCRHSRYGTRGKTSAGCTASSGTPHPRPSPLGSRSASAGPSSSRH